MAENRYYAHSRNAFWPIVSDLLNFPPDASYAQRCRSLVHRRIALWDVVASARRPGSLDSAIDSKSVQYNEINELLKDNDNISTVMLNGKTAGRYFKRYQKLNDTPELAALVQIVLPSTSPAHAAMRFDEKLERWRHAFASAGLMESEPGV